MSQDAMKTSAQNGSKSWFLQYWKDSGPGWLQSAITLGAGTLASSLFLGVVGGCDLIWVQPCAMASGAVMLAAIAYATLSMQRSPFDAIRRDLNPVLAWGWLLGALFNNTIYALPQFAASYAAITENLIPGVLPASESGSTRLLVSLVLFGIIASITFTYENGSRGVVIYERVMKSLVAVVVLSFVVVALKLTGQGLLPWETVFNGLWPDWEAFRRPVGDFNDIADEIADPVVRAYWIRLIHQAQIEPMIGAAAAAVGVNMTFLLPYSLLARGWKLERRGFALCDIGLGMAIPFALTTSCIVIAAAAQFHAKTPDGISITASGSVEIDAALAGTQMEEPFIRKKDRIESMLRARLKEIPRETVPVTALETKLAAMLLRRDNMDLALSLERLTGSRMIAHKVFGLGVLAMAVSTASLLMVISGFAVREALGARPGGRTEKLGMLLAGLGVLWPLLWQGESKAYLAVSVGLIGYTLLPLAFVAFFALMNSRRILGDHRPRGGRRWIWNSLMGLSILVSGGSSLLVTWRKKVEGFPIGPVVLIVFIAAVLASHFWSKSRRSNQQ